MIKLFISHASEDKDDFARPLAERLGKNFDVWFDEQSLTIGDSLLQKIQEGLIESDYGVVILSPSFFMKKWPQAELDGFFALEVQNKKRILPIWKDLAFNDVLRYSPIMAGRLAINADIGIDAVVNSIERAVFSELDVGATKPLYQVSITEMDTTLDILTNDGRTVNFTDRFKLTALIDGVKTYTEQFQADGRIDSFWVDPGKIISIRKEESIIYLDSEFNEPMNRGESIQRCISCVYHDSFTSNEEYWVIRQSNPNSNSCLKIIFPKDRPPISFKGIIRKLNYDQLATENSPYSEARADGRVQIVWNIKKLGLMTSYKLIWSW